MIPHMKKNFAVIGYGGQGGCVYKADTYDAVSVRRAFAILT